MGRKECLSCTFHVHLHLRIIFNLPFVCRLLFKLRVRFGRVSLVHAKQCGLELQLSRHISGAPFFSTPSRKNQFVHCSQPGTPTPLRLSHTWLPWCGLSEIWLSNLVNIRNAYSLSFFAHTSSNIFFLHLNGSSHLMGWRTLLWRPLT